MKLPRRQFLAARAIALPVICGIAVALSGLGAWSQTARTIKIIVPLAPGGGSDILARVMADQISRAQSPTIIVENRAVTLVDGMTAVYGLSGSAQVKDAHKALYSAQSFSEVPIFVSLCCSRSVLNACTSSQLMNQRAVEEQISQQAKLKLESQGFGLLTFRLTQLSVAMPSEEPDEDPTETVES